MQPCCNDARRRIAVCDFLQLFPSLAIGQDDGTLLAERSEIVITEKGRNGLHAVDERPPKIEDEGRAPWKEKGRQASFHQDIAGDTAWRAAQGPEASCRWRCCPERGLGGVAASNLRADAHRASGTLQLAQFSMLPLSTNGGTFPPAAAAAPTRGAQAPQRAVQSGWSACAGGDAGSALSMNPFDGPSAQQQATTLGVPHDATTEGSSAGPVDSSNTLLPFCSRAQ
jgi:hypothetical protein